MDCNLGWRLDFKSVIVSVVCAIGAATGSVLLYIDFTQTGVHGHGATMAKVEKRQVQVRRKFSNSYVWNNIGANEDLFQHDSVQTSDLSAAVLRMNDGTTLELGENSLVVIDNTADLSLGFLKGSLVIRRATGDSQLSFSKEGKIKVEALPVRLVHPAPLSKVFVAQGEPQEVTFSWERKSKSALTYENKIILQVSTDKNFSSNQTQSFESNQQQYRVKLSTGRYYWRVASQNSVLSAPTQFEIARVSAAQLISPAENQGLTSAAADSALEFRWVSQSLEDGAHTIEVANDRQFQQIVSSEPVSLDNGVANLKNIQVGSHFWRIVSRYQELTIYSNVEPFTIVKSGQSTVAAQSTTSNPLREPAAAKSDPASLEMPGKPLGAPEITSPEVQ